MEGINFTNKAQKDDYERSKFSARFWTTTN